MEHNMPRGGIAKGSRVLVKGQSFKNIEDVKVGDLVSTPKGWQLVKSVFDHGVQKIIRTIHQDGYIDCVPSQKIAILTDHLGTCELKQTNDLKKDEIFMFVKNDDREGINKLPEFKYDNKIDTGYKKSKSIKIPELDGWMAWLIGEVQGDGNVYLNGANQQYYVKICCEPNNPEKSEKIKDQLNMFCDNVKIIKTQKKKDNYINYYDILAKSKQLSIYFYSWLKKPKKTIRIPDCIKNSSREMKLAYLQGVLDADGYAKQSQVVKTIYEDFAKDIQCLLHSIGIVSRLRKSSKDKNPNANQKYCIFIVNNEDRDLFGECKIGYKKFLSSKRQIHSNCYPEDFFKNIESKNRPKYWGQNIPRRGNIPYSKWNKVFGPSKIVPIAFMMIEDTHQESATYGIEVEGGHNFICEGILVESCYSCTVLIPAVE